VLCCFDVAAVERGLKLREQRFAYAAYLLEGATHTRLDSACGVQPTLSTTKANESFRPNVSLTVTPRSVMSIAANQYYVQFFFGWVWFWGLLRRFAGNGRS